MNYKRLFVPGSYIFVTIVTKNRKPILIEYISALRKAFRIAIEKFPFEIVAIIVNKDHLHMIIKPENVQDYPKIVGNIKSSFTKISGLNYSANNNRESDVWQRRYWEHTITDEEDFCKHLDYIHYNSMKHYQLAPQKWKYSSFQKFVKMGYYEKDWCNFDDKHDILSMNYE